MNLSRRVVFLDIVKALIALLCCITVGTAALVISFSIPTAKIEEHVIESVPVFQEEGNYPNLVSWASSRLDNYTDAIMLLTAAFNSDESAFEKAMLAKRPVIVPYSEAENLVARYTEPNAQESANIESYARYWHGYLIMLKPILLLLNYQQIRILNLIIQTILSAVVLYLMIRKGLRQYAIAYIIAICLINPVALAFSMQYADIYYIFTIANICLLLFYEKWKEKHTVYLFFFILGCATAYFDFLTYPIAALGMPLVVLVCLDNNNDVASNVKKIILYSFVWGMGYVGMWGSKWIIASLCTSENVILDALQSLRERTGLRDGIGDYPIISILAKNGYHFVRTPVMLVAFLYIVAKAHRMKKNHGKLNMNWVITFGILCLIPGMWYLATRNHAYIHGCFTGKNLIVTAFAGMCMFSRLSMENNAKP